MSNEEFIDETGSAEQASIEVDSIWLTKPSIKPIVLAASCMLALIGLYGFRPLMFAALLAAVITIIAWISDSREESDELPLS